mmetsp:Transcript_105652/g.340533  ORF Transcript_105652/g.340533 Transcript_105652/m.340533 type:complete len:483 (+) Transcript_105652:303-1751(+)
MSGVCPAVPMPQPACLPGPHSHGVFAAIRPAQTGECSHNHRDRHAHLAKLDRCEGAQRHRATARRPRAAGLECAVHDEDRGHQQPHGRRVQAGQGAAVEAEGPQLPPKWQRAKGQDHARAHQAHPAQHRAGHPGVAAGERQLDTQEARHVEDRPRHHLCQCDACEEDGALDPSRRQHRHEHRQHNRATSPDEHASSEERDEPTMVNGRSVDRPSCEQQVRDEDQRTHSGGQSVVVLGTAVLGPCLDLDRRDRRDEAAEDDQSGVQPSRLRVQHHARRRGAEADRSQLGALNTFLDQARDRDEHKRHSHRRGADGDGICLRSRVLDLILQGVRHETEDGHDDRPRDQEGEARDESPKNSLLGDADGKSHLGARRTGQAICHSDQLHVARAGQPLLLLHEAVLKVAEVHGRAPECRAAQNQEVPCQHRDGHLLLRSLEQRLLPGHRCTRLRPRERRQGGSRGGGAECDERWDLQGERARSATAP